MINDLDIFFHPKSVAVVGATPKGGFPLRVLEIIKKSAYSGEIYVVNPNYQEVMGIESHPSVPSIPQPVELCIIAVNASRVEDIVNDCITKQVKGLIILSGGFAETGVKGREIEERIKEKCLDNKIRVIGPNCMGVLNFSENISFTASTLMDRTLNNRIYPVALFSQSGGVGTVLCSEALNRGIGFKYFLSTGNQMDVDVFEAATYAVEDAEIAAIGIYTETIKNKSTLVKLAERAADKGKVLVLLKSGRTESGQRTAASHTGSIANDDLVINTLISDLGIIRVNDLDELLNFLFASSTGRYLHGNRVGIITNSGGISVIMTDHCEDNGLQTSQFNNSFREEISKILPDYGSSRNPIDVGASIMNNPDIIGQLLERLMKNEDIDIVLITLGLFDKYADSIINDIKKINNQAEKPIFITWVGANDDTIQRLRQSGLTYFTDPTKTIQTASLLFKYQKMRQKRTAVNATIDLNRQNNVIKYINDLYENKRTALSEYELRWILAQYDLPLVKAELVKSSEEAEIAAAKIGLPIVMKIDSPDIMHKSDIGCVVVGIDKEENIKESFKKILNNAHKYRPDATINGILVEKMVTDGIETIIGVKVDNIFGPLIGFGLGGVFVEIFKDMVFRTVPINDLIAQDMINQIKSRIILQGYRGKPAASEDLLVRTLVGISNMVVEIQEYLKEIDINPLIIKGDQAFIVDALLTLNISGKIS